MQPLVNILCGSAAINFVAQSVTVFAATVINLTTAALSFTVNVVSNSFLVTAATATWNFIAEAITFDTGEPVDSSPAPTQSGGGPTYPSVRR